jgi:hypothetical protein
LSFLIDLSFFETRKGQFFGFGSKKLKEAQISSKSLSLPTPVYVYTIPFESFQ